MNQFSSKEIKIKDPLQRDVKKPNYFYTFIIQKKSNSFMKNIFLLLSALLLLFPTNINSQVGGIGGSDYEMVFVPGAKEDKSDFFKKIAPKMYASVDYLAAMVDDINESFFLRYNIYRDEMEFLKNGKTLYLKKNEKRKIIFSKSQENFRLFKLNNKLRYFTVHNIGDNLLLSRKIVEYQEAKLAASSYQKDKPADFKMKENKKYIRFNQTLVEVPKRKNKFNTIFGPQSSAIKKYVKNNKLNIKNIEDLKTIVQYYNKL